MKGRSTRNSERGVAMEILILVLVLVGVAMSGAVLGLTAYAISLRQD
jgi:hypothetical protein